MSKLISYQQSQSLSNPLWIDVRSSKEFEHGHLPNAINLPVMDNQTRHEVGTLYKQGKIDSAKQVGINYMSGVLPTYFSQILTHSHRHSLIFYCKSGGFRSSSIVGLLQGLGLNVYQLAGGYQTYRQYVLESLEKLPEQFQFVSLDGMTGTGKTLILNHIEALGGQVLDLEGLANHRGSHFGKIGLGPQPSQANYEAALVAKLETFKPGIVFIEGESASIGKVHTPLTLYNVYKQSPHQVYIDSPLDLRIQRIEEEYINTSDINNLEEIKKTLINMNKMNSERKSKHLQALDQGDYASVIEDLIVSYYDQHYTLKNKVFEYQMINYHSKDTARALLDLYEAL
ncbi:tRNA 2-selenouridine(34) synthase MnmH [Facklamia sp. 7083-14-GEN3]|uniref:tRNA 2-selenouridine(34) synthase MnmH n=1 Tax=Facklamia sp. 7083-14-GEN3 TaxID=2973478 RepID=UPI00215CCD86|nr:tRNA 2-selenouridine(34) synthase MnmH [Facklamia sp. 7083-14-GEN3]MCR8969346.1 tRNA 2-selenouridine(34) synthase MnmH [Facklamia sp. 7083-14-GEN3]